MLRKTRTRKAGRSRRSWLSTCSMGALVTLLLGQPGRCSLTNLVNLLTPVANFSVTSGSSVLDDVNYCMDGDYEETKCKWKDLDSTGVLQIDLTTTVNVGSIVFVMSEYSGDLDKVATFRLFVEGIECNGGQPVQNNGVVNCLVPNAQYITLESPSYFSIDKPGFSEIYVFEEPDFAQRYLDYIDLPEGGTVTSGALEDAIGLGGSLTGLNVQIDFPSGLDEDYRYIQVRLTRILPDAIVFVTQTEKLSQYMYVDAYDRYGDGYWDYCGDFDLDRITPQDQLCDTI